MKVLRENFFKISFSVTESSTRTQQQSNFDFSALIKKFFPSPPTIHKTFIVRLRLRTIHRTETLPHASTAVKRTPSADRRVKKKLGISVPSADFFTVESTLIANYFVGAVIEFN